ncbi:hypothetical protein P171DRAFT_485608 [Karstenula rhodostoma CBS 690.94]|uniref:Uncharacterized protein n=1 Tax=Karstenula rhodostoma CBS 690.94 TaxID=1392251 RepID=A0A9P4PFL5_9PLEO|nr:hypothetical protein P171DRAFT_485608 [Karstenula rhodostoma CBS 690.94]
MQSVEIVMQDVFENQPQTIEATGILTSHEEPASFPSPSGLATDVMHDRKRKANAQAGATSKKSKTRQNQYEGIIRSEKEYTNHLLNDWWDFDIVFSGPNEAHVLNSNVAFIDFDPDQWRHGDLRSGNDEIAPVFARENWLLEGFVKNPDLVWWRMESALRMASLFLTVPQAAWAYLPLVVDEPLDWHGGGKILSYDSQERISKLTPEEAASLANNLKLVGQRFAALAGKVKFTFATFGKMHHWPADEENFALPKTDAWSDMPGPQIHGAHHGPGEPYLSEIYVKGDPAELEACQNSHRIILNGSYAEWFQYDANKMTATQIARTLFTFGITLMHELSHALYCQEKHPEIFKSGKYTNYDEPHMFTDMNGPEIGSAMERRLFGHPWQASVHPERGAEMEAMHVPCTWDEGHLIVGKAHVANYIEPTWCYEFLTKEKWQKIRSIPLENSRNCCNWPSFRVHARTKQPSIKAWWEAKKAGKKTKSMPNFDCDPRLDGWEIVFGIENQNVDGTWDTNISAYDEQATAVLTLDQEFLEWKVQEARKARAKEMSSGSPQESREQNSNSNVVPTIPLQLWRMPATQEDTPSRPASGEGLGCFL